MQNTFLAVHKSRSLMSTAVPTAGSSTAAQIDYLAVSFAESRSDIEEARAFLDRHA